MATLHIYHATNGSFPLIMKSSHYSAVSFHSASNTVSFANRHGPIHSIYLQSHAYISTLAVSSQNIIHPFLYQTTMATSHISASLSLPLKKFTKLPIHPHTNTCLSIAPLIPYSNCPPTPQIWRRAQRASLPTLSNASTRSRKPVYIVLAFRK